HSLLITSSSDPTHPPDLYPLSLHDALPIWVVVDRPDRRGRAAILKVHTRSVPLAPDVDLDIIARSTPGQIGADQSNLVNEAALQDRKSTRLNSSHRTISYAVFCLKKKTTP